MRRSCVVCSKPVGEYANIFACGVCHQFIAIACDDDAKDPTLEARVRGHMLCEHPDVMADDINAIARDPKAMAQIEREMKCAPDEYAKLWRALRAAQQLAVVH